MEDTKFNPEEFDIVISSLAFHYIKNLDEICKKIYNSISDGGDFIFLVEHPIFTSNNNQDWYYAENGFTITKNF